MHGEATKRTPEYQAWTNMKQRCLNRNGPRFKDWGGRGIRVCDRWLAFENFLADMGRRPSRLHSLDRIDPDGHYEPGNCRWATRREQQRNRRDNETLTAFGKTQSIDDWADEFGVHRALIRGRIKQGWVDAERILTAPSHARPSNVLVRGNGKPNIAALARQAGVPVATVHWRVKHGATLEEALRR